MTSSSPVDSMAKAMEGKNRIQGMVRSIDQYRNGDPKAIADGSYAQVLYALTDYKHDVQVLWDFAVATAHQADAMKREMAALLDTEALSGIRALVAGWNGEHLPDDERFGRHPDELGVKLPTTCGAVYALDEAMIRARALIGGGNED